MYSGFTYAHLLYAMPPARRTSWGFFVGKKHQIGYLTTQRVMIFGVLHQFSEAVKQDLAPPGQFPLKSSAKKKGGT
jgi:hypothetical protein